MRRHPLAFAIRRSSRSVRGDAALHSTPRWQTLRVSANSVLILRVPRTSSGLRSRKRRPATRPMPPRGSRGRNTRRTRPPACRKPPPRSCTAPSPRAARRGRRRRPPGTSARPGRRSRRRQLREQQRDHRDGAQHAHGHAARTGVPAYTPAKTQAAYTPLRHAMRYTRPRALGTGPLTFPLARKNIPTVRI